MAAPVLQPAANDNDTLATADDASSSTTIDPSSSRHRDYGFCCGLLTPVHVDEWHTKHPHQHLPGSSFGPNTTFWTWPLLGPLLFENESSDARDHAANERTFLSYLRLSVYMSVVAVAITLSFHLKSQPTDVELRMARPLGLIFWLLAVACLFLGLGNYITTINKYSRKTAIVQTGWRTQSVMSLIGLSIVGTCVVLLVVAKLKVDYECDSLTDSDCTSKMKQAAVSRLDSAYRAVWAAA